MIFVLDEEIIRMEITRMREMYKYLYLPIYKCVCVIIFVLEEEIAAGVVFRRSTSFSSKPVERECSHSLIRKRILLETLYFLCFL